VGQYNLATHPDELAGFSRVAAGQQPHRPFRIGKQHGDLHALAFEGRLGGEDFLGQIPRGGSASVVGEAQQAALGSEP
jgi:hypothetical protein